MGVFFVYILKSSICLAMFYLFYRLLLSKETFHRFNRVALLGVLVFSCLVPMIEVTGHGFQEMNQPFLSLEDVMMVVETEPEGVLTETSASFPWRALVLLLYISGVLFSLLRHLWSFGRMACLLRASRRERLEVGITLFVHRKKVAPFSWMKMIAVSEEDLEENRNAVLAHECAHIRNRHSWDLLLAEACVFLQWFNPAAWLLKQELQTIHEYEADEWVIENGIDAKTYQLLIIKKAVGARLYSIANSLNHSSLKKRITMMIKKKSNPWARLKYLYVLPMAAIAVVAFARPEVSYEFNEISSAKVNDLTSIVKAKEVKSVEKISNEKFNVSGRVMEAASKKPLPGASVMIRDTETGVITDMEGKFGLPVKRGDVIRVSYVGLQTQSVVVKDNSELVVWMRDDVQSMEEMIVYAPERTEDAEKENGVVVFDMPIKEVQKTEEPQEEVIFRIVEEMPQFPGGKQKAMEFIANHIKYPEVAQKARIEGRVIVQFVVGRDGSISDVQTVSGISPELDAEAMRVVGLMPKWIPGKQRNKAVTVKYTMPITFRLNVPTNAEQEQAPAYHQVNGAEAFRNNADGVKYAQVKQGEKHKELEMQFDKGVNKEVGKLSVGGFGKRGYSFVTVSVDNDKSPLIIVDGKEMGRGTDILEKIPVDQIETISVKKHSEAIAEYGDKAKDGVISIVMKKNEE